MTDALSIRIAPLAPEEVGLAAAIEAESLPRPWPVEVLERDVARNPQAVYFAAHVASGDPRRPGTSLVGFIGAWLQVDEIHVTTIAVHPAWRRRRVGERLMLHLIDHALAQGAQIVTLEVRPSNTAAQRLYAKLGFAEVGRRVRYYPDSGEDAIIMTTPPLTDPAWLDRIARLR